MKMLKRKAKSQITFTQEFPKLFLGLWLSGQILVLSFLLCSFRVTYRHKRGVQGVAPTA